MGRLNYQRHRVVRPRPMRRTIPTSQTQLIEVAGSGARCQRNEGERIATRNRRSMFWPFQNIDRRSKTVLNLCGVDTWLGAPETRTGYRQARSNPG
ncbi:hypothetical protein HMPREF9577_00785 [Cutibacterium acnes HL110PA3]|nr:hypothetical protein HMPREF9577_00785 [Cutibacterium acnes HL110PA3]